MEPGMQPRSRIIVKSPEKLPLKSGYVRGEEIKTDDAAATEQIEVRVEETVDADEDTDPISTNSLAPQKESRSEHAEQDLALQRAHRLLAIIDTIERSIESIASGTTPERPELARVRGALRMRQEFVMDVGDRFQLKHFATILRQHAARVETNPSTTHLQQLEAVSTDIFNELRQYTHLSPSEKTVLPIATTESIKAVKLLAHREKMAFRAQRRPGSGQPRSIPITAPKDSIGITAYSHVPTLQIPKEKSGLIILTPDELEQMNQDRIRVEDEQRSTAHEMRMREFIRIEEAAHAQARAQNDVRVAEYIAETRAAQKAERVAVIEHEASEREAARLEKTNAKIAKNVADAFDTLRTKNDARINIEDADSRPAARAIKIIEARSKAYEDLQDMEAAAQKSFFSAIGNSLARANERRRISSYSQQLETIYSNNPGVQKEIRSMLTEPHLSTFQRAEDRKTEQRTYEENKLRTAETAALLATRPDAQRLRSIQMEKILAQTIGERRLLAKNVPTTAHKDLIHFSQRITHLRNAIKNAKPGFFDRLLGTDPAEAQRKELAYAEQRVQALIEKYPQLIP